MNQHEPIQLEYFTDVLCVWAWIAQPRLKELQKQWSGRIELQYRYIDVFGDCHKKIPTQWGTENGFEKFSEHVCHAASDYEETPVNSSVWRNCRPRSSMQAHLFLKAAELCSGAHFAGQYAETIRRAFFIEAKDIGDQAQLAELASQSGIREIFRDAEVDEFDLTLELILTAWVTDEYICEFDIAMNDAVVVHRLKRIRGAGERFEE